MGVTLREGNREYFYKQLDRHFPGMKEKYIRMYGFSYMLESPNSKELMSFFRRRCKEAGILCNNEQIFEYLNEFEDKLQTRLSLF